MQDYTPILGALAERIVEAERYLRKDELLSFRLELEAEVGRPDLWDDPEAAAGTQRDLSRTNEDLELLDSMSTQLEDAETLYELASEEHDESLVGEIDNLVSSLSATLDALELRSLFTGDYDEGDALCTLQSGAGGTDAQDWAEMMFRMYQRWSEQRGFAVETTDVSAGTEAGISSAEFVVKGRYAYGLLQSERGVHRLVRQSPFNKDAKRQTAFSSLKVIPFVEEVDVEIVIDDKDLRIDTYRSSGAGGQHVNVTDSAVRITHLPTGLVTSCQNERSQHQNKDRAMVMLKMKLAELEREARKDELESQAGESRAVDFGSQIRSYVLHPYQMVKDVRTDHEDSDTAKVLDGGLDPFIESYLRWKRAEGEVGE
jgi:peptide chain release factor 2